MWKCCVMFQSLAAMKRQQGIATTTMAVRQSIQDNELVRHVKSFLSSLSAEAALGGTSL